MADDIVACEVLEDLRSELSRLLDLRCHFQFINYLKSKRMLSGDEEDDIMAERTRSRQVNRFLDILKQRGFRGFMYFCEAIQDDRTHTELLTKILVAFEKKKNKMVGGFRYPQQETSGNSSNFSLVSETVLFNGCFAEINEDDLPLPGQLGAPSLPDVSKWRSIWNRNRRYWCTITEHTSELHYFSSNKQNKPVGVIKLKDASIALDVQNPNQFMIRTGQEEYLCEATDAITALKWAWTIQAECKQASESPLSRSRCNSFSDPIFRKEKLKSSTSIDSAVTMDSMCDKLSDLVKTSNCPMLRLQLIKECNENLLQQNTFLSEEVKRLFLLTAECATNYKELQDELNARTVEMKNLQRDYTLLLNQLTAMKNSRKNNTLITCRHKSRLCHLLEEARKLNSHLPSLDSFKIGDCYADEHGFKHVFVDEKVLLQYICRLLCQHYRSYSIDIPAWKNQFESPSDFTINKSLKILIRQGVPNQYRTHLWELLIHSHIKDIKEAVGDCYYSNLKSRIPESKEAQASREQIERDLCRTMPANLQFSGQTSPGVQKLYEVLEAFCMHCPEIGYCQGMNFMAAVGLLFLTPEQTFWLLITIAYRLLSPSYFCEELHGAQVDQELIKELLRMKLPKLNTHLASYDVDITNITLPWFMGLFYDIVPFEVMLQIWDCFLVDGVKALFRFSIALLTLHEDLLVTIDDYATLVRTLKTAPARYCDTETLVKVAYEGFESFPTRRSIAAKQAYYSNMLHKGDEAARQRTLSLLSQNGSESCAPMLYCSDVQMYHACLSAKDESVWVCESSNSKSFVYRVHNAISFETAIKVYESVTGMEICGSDELLALCTTACRVYLYTLNDRKLQNTFSLREVSLCLQWLPTNNICVGLADGCLAVIQNPLMSDSSLLYIDVGSSPVTYIKCLEQKLWCSSGANIVIYDSVSLDHLSSFQVSSAPGIQIGCMEYSNSGIWISLKASPILMLWDVDLLICNLVFNIYEGKKVTRQWNSFDEAYEKQQPSWITAILATDDLDQVVIGTYSGDILTYHITEDTDNQSLYELKPAKLNMELSNEVNQQQHHRYTAVCQIQEKRDSGFQSDEPILLYQDSHFSDSNSNNEETLTETENPKENFFLGSDKFDNTVISNLVYQECGIFKYASKCPLENAGMPSTVKTANYQIANQNSDTKPESDLTHCYNEEILTRCNSYGDAKIQDTYDYQSEKLHESLVQKSLNFSSSLDTLQHCCTENFDDNLSSSCDKAARESNEGFCSKTSESIPALNCSITLSKDMASGLHLCDNFSVEASDNKADTFTNNDAVSEVKNVTDGIAMPKINFPNPNVCVENYDTSLCYSVPNTFTHPKFHRHLHCGDSSKFSSSPASYCGSILSDLDVSCDFNLNSASSSYDLSSSYRRGSFLVKNDIRSEISVTGLDSNFQLNMVQALQMKGPPQPVRALLKCSIKETYGIVTCPGSELGKLVSRWNWNSEKHEWDMITKQAPNM